MSTGCYRFYKIFNFGHFVIFFLRQAYMTIKGSNNFFQTTTNGM